VKKGGEGKNLVGRRRVITCMEVVLCVRRRELSGKSFPLLFDDFLPPMVQNLHSVGVSGVVIKIEALVGERKLGWWSRFRSWRRNGLDIESYRLGGRLDWCE
jgi:hypothetical protein